MEPSFNGMKEQIENKTVKDGEWVTSHRMVADVFTKANVNPDPILSVISSGKLPM